MTCFSEYAQWISGPAYDYGPDDAGYYDDHRAQVLVRSFELKEVPAEASLLVAVLGYERTYVNGHRASSAELVGDWTNYTKLVYYHTYDVTELLRPGTNEIRIELGNGWYSPAPLTLFGKYNLRQRLAEVGTPQALVTLVAREEPGVELYARHVIPCGDGSEERILLVSDASWGYVESDLLFNNIYLGEKRDLRLRETAPAPVTVWGPNTRELAPSVVPPIRRAGVVSGVDVREVELVGRDDAAQASGVAQAGDGKQTGERVLLIDLHEMVTGFASISFAAHAGQEVTIRYAELADKNGLPVFASNRAGMVGTTIPHAAPDGSDVVVPGGSGAPAVADETDRIVCREGENHFQSEFCTHSFRYAAIWGLRRKDLRNFRAIYVHTGMEPAGSIRTGNRWYDALIDAALRTKLNNIHGVWEDCARERLGYGGDMVALATSNLLSYNAEGLIRKTVRDFRNDQTPAGGVPETAPYMGIQSSGTGQGEGPLLWQLAYPELTLRAWRWYGARDLVDEELPYLERLADYLLSRDPEELSQHCLGDHGSVETKEVKQGDWKGGTPDRDFTSWCAILWIVKDVEKLARVGEDSEAVGRYAAAAERLRAQIGEKFVHADGTVANGTQTAYAFAGGLGLMNRQAAGDALAAKMDEEDGVLSCGIFGASFAWSLLHETGHDDAVERWLQREGDPSYHCMLANGSGALAEQFHVTVDSYNHAMFSSYVQWFYEALGGIKVASDAVAANHVEIRPYFSPATDHVRASYPTPAGSVCVSWDRETPDSVQLEVEVPAGVRADVELPAGYSIVRHDARSWLLSGK